MIPSYPMCYPSADKADLDMWPHKVYKFVASHSKKGGTAALFSAYQAVLDDIFRSHGPFVIEEICRKDSETPRDVALLVSFVVGTFRMPVFMVHMSPAELITMPHDRAYVDVRTRALMRYVVEDHLRNAGGDGQATIPVLWALGAIGYDACLYRSHGSWSDIFPKHGNRITRTPRYWYRLNTLAPETRVILQHVAHEICHRLVSLGYSWNGGGLGRYLEPADVSYLPDYARENELVPHRISYWAFDDGAEQHL